MPRDPSDRPGQRSARLATVAAVLVLVVPGLLAAPASALADSDGCSEPHLDCLEVSAQTRAVTELLEDTGALARGQVLEMATVSHQICDGIQDDAGTGGDVRTWASEVELPVGVPVAGTLGGCDHLLGGMSDTIDADEGDGYVLDVEAGLVYDVRMVGPGWCYVFRPDHAPTRCEDGPIVAEEDARWRVIVHPTQWWTPLGEPLAPTPYMVSARTSRPAADPGPPSDHAGPSLDGTAVMVPGEPVDDPASTGTVPPGRVTSRARRPALPDRSPPVMSVILPAIVAGTALVGWILYRRLKRDALLDNDLRAAIVRHAAGHPGIAAAELARRLDVALNTVLYHVRLLAEHDVVTIKRVAGSLRLTRTGDVDDVQATVAAYLRHDAKRRVLQAVRDRPGIHVAEVARHLDRAKSTVKRHLDALVDDGLVEARREGRRRTFRLAEPVRSVLDGEA